MLADPGLGGGFRSVEDMLINYLKSDKKDLNLLLNYAERLGNGAVYKRLGFLLEQKAPEEQEVIRQCRERLTPETLSSILSLPSRPINHQMAVMGSGANSGGEEP